MGTKVKGILKGLRYISQIFEDDKEAEMQIGFPTDVKHVAHIGWDGPSVHSPSWMSKFKTTPEFSSTSTSLGVTGDPPTNESTTAKWDSEDSSREREGTRAIDSVLGRDLLPELPRTSRHQSPSESPIRDKTAKSRTSRRQHSESADGIRLRKQQHQDPTLPTSESDSPLNCLPDIPKKSRRKKSKDTSIGGPTRPSRQKGNSAATSTNTNTGAATSATTPNVVDNTSSNYASPYSDPGPGPGAAPKFTTNASYKTSTLQEFEARKGKSGVNGIS